MLWGGWMLPMKSSKEGSMTDPKDSQRMFMPNTKNCIVSIKQYSNPLLHKTSKSSATLMAITWKSYYALNE